MLSRIATVFLFSITSFAIAENYISAESKTPGAWFIQSIEKTRPSAEKYYFDRLVKLADAPKRAKDAETYHILLEQHFKSNRAEDEAIEKYLGWKKGDFTFHNNRFYSRTGCTSWIITPEVSSSGACIVQKNRDYSGQNLLSVRLFRAMPGRYKILTVNDLWSSGAGAVMNEKGLMIVQNDNSTFEKLTVNVNVGCIFILRYIAENYATCEEAVAALKKFYDTGIGRSTSIYLIADLNKAAIVETTPKHTASTNVDFGFEVRANNFLLAGMRGVNKKSQKNFLNGANRRFSASEFLRSTVEDKGKIAPADLMDLARLRDPEQEKDGFRQVCQKTTLASTMFVPDRQFPDVLSVAYIAVGPTRHTAFLPVAMGLSALPESIANGDWGTVALKLKEKLPLDHDKIGEFKKLELGFIEEFNTAKEQARLLLVKNKRAEAVQLLDSLFRKQYEKAVKFLESVQ